MKCNTLYYNMLQKCRIAAGATPFPIVFHTKAIQHNHIMRVFCGGAQARRSGRFFGRAAGNGRKALGQLYQPVEAPLGIAPGALDHELVVRA